MSASGLPWFRLYAEIIDNETVRLLAFEDRWHFVAIMACKCSGLLDSEGDNNLLRRKLSVKLGLALRELEAMAERLGEVGLIDPETFQPKGWDDRQFKSDTSRERVRAFRDRKKQGSNVTETAQDTDSDLDTEKALRQGAGKAKAKSGSESQLEAAIAHAHYVFTLNGNAEERDAAIAAAKTKHGAMH